MLSEYVASHPDVCDKGKSHVDCDQERSSVTKERQRQTGHWKNVHGHPDIENDVRDKNRQDTNNKQIAKPVFRVQREKDRAVNEQCIENQDKCTSYETS